jgi:hypothetical protein
VLARRGLGFDRFSLPGRRNRLQRAARAARAARDQEMPIPVMACDNAFVRESPRRGVADIRAARRLEKAARFTSRCQLPGTEESCSAGRWGHIIHLVSPTVLLFVERVRNSTVIVQHQLGNAKLSWQSP